MTTRRSFLKLTGATTLAWYVATQTGWMERAIAQIPGGTLNPSSVEVRHADADPPVMPRAATLTRCRAASRPTTTRSQRQFQQQILPAGMPKTTVWGYGAIKSASSRGLLIHHAPSLTIESTWKRPVRIKWINDLKDGGNYLPHLLPVDPTLHWANPPGGTGDRDSRPSFTSTPTRYTGPVPIVTHLHGAAGVRRAMATPRPGTYPTPTTSPPAMPPRAPGTTSLPARLDRSSPSRGGRIRDLPVPQRPA